MMRAPKWPFFLLCCSLHSRGQSVKCLAESFVSVLSCWFWAKSNPENGGQPEDAHFSCVKDDYYDLFNECLQTRKLEVSTCVKPLVIFSTSPLQGDRRYVGNPPKWCFILNFFLKFPMRITSTSFFPSPVFQFLLCSPSRIHNFFFCDCAESVYCLSAQSCADSAHTLLGMTAGEQTTCMGACPWGNGFFLSHSHRLPVALHLG